MGLCFRPRRPLLLLTTCAATSGTSARPTAQDVGRRLEAAPHADTPAPHRSASAAAPPGAELVDELEHLTRLRESGVLTHEEFTAAKMRALGL